MGLVPSAAIVGGLIGGALGWSAKGLSTSPGLGPALTGFSLSVAVRNKLRGPVSNNSARHRARDINERADKLRKKLAAILVNAVSAVTQAAPVWERHNRFKRQQIP